jgi:exonuclease III
MNTSTRTNPNSLTLLSWYCNGIHNKKHELFQYAVAHNIDIIFLQETHLNANISFHSPHYTIHRHDRLKQRGVVAILVRKSLPHSLLDLPPLKFLEALGISINTSFGPLNLFSVYHPASKALCRSDLTSQFRAHSRGIYIGDWNSKHSAWNCLRGNSNGRILYAFLKNHPISEALPKSQRTAPAEEISAVIF